MIVDLHPPEWAEFLQSDLSDWQKDPLPVAKLAPFEIPDDAYFEYAWVDVGGERRPDPGNTNPRLNPWWDFACNITGPEYRPHPLTTTPKERPQGRVLRLELPSRILGKTRRLMVYSPAGMADSELPLILFQDGKAYFGWGGVPGLLDLMLEAGQVGAAHLVFVPPELRTPEYFFNPVYRRFLLEEVLPLVESRVRCDGRRTAWGASLGGLLSAQLAFENQDLFQKVVAQSGAFLFSPGMEEGNPFVGDEAFAKEVLAGDPAGLEWCLDCGSLEWLLESNRNLGTALERRGARIDLEIRNAGHNWVNWRNGIPRGLAFASPPRR